MENLYLLPPDSIGLGNRLINEGVFGSLISALGKKHNMRDSLSLYVSPSGHATIRISSPCEKANEIFSEIRVEYLAMVKAAFKKKTQADLNAM